MRNLVERNRWNLWRCGARLGLLVALLTACDSRGTHSEADRSAAKTPPADVQTGEAKFAAHCAACHGTGAVGTKQGPPLVHKIYEPNHHADAAFQRAVEQGVRAHHWEFGNMPKIDGVTATEVDHIIRYVRWLQREAGIY